MPLIKQPDTLSDLIRKGARKKQKLQDERQKQSAHYCGWHLSAVPESIAYDSDSSPLVDPDEKDEMLRFSSLILWVAEMRFLSVLRNIAIILAFVILTVDSNESFQHTAKGVLIFLDYFVNTFNILDGSLKLGSLYSYLTIAKNCKQSVTLTNYCRRSGALKILLSVLCLVYQQNQDVEKWLHLVRCVILSLFYLEQMPQLDVLMSGIAAGLKSTIYMWSLMILIFLVFSATGVIFFRENDPYHFGSIGMAMWTCFEMTTLDNWSEVLYTNSLGCDKYDGGRYLEANRTQTVHTGYGTFFLPTCAAPQGRPLIAPVIFIGFILICGFVMVSFSVAFVTTGINNKLQSFKAAEEEEELLAERGQVGKKKHPHKLRRKSVVQTSMLKGKTLLVSTSNLVNLKLLSQSKEKMHPGVSGDADLRSTDGLGSRQSSSSELGIGAESSRRHEVDVELLKTLLQHIWSNVDESILKEGVSDLGSKRKVRAAIKATGTFSEASFRRALIMISSSKNQGRSEFSRWMMSVGVYLRQIVNNKFYVYVISIAIVLAAVIQLLSVEGRVDHAAAIDVEVFFQVLFSFDLIIKYISNSPRYFLFFENSMNVFDTVLVGLLWIPILAVGADQFIYFDLLKVLRIIRVLKIFSWILEVNIIMKSIATSARCLVYVVFLMMVFFFHLGVAGVYLFGRNDPFHFADIGKALQTLFQISTLDDWTDIARMNMYGCIHVEHDPTYCLEENSFGWGWVAAWYFVIFVIVGVMVLVALFVGVIITSMELLQTSINEEDKMLKKVAAKQNQYNISDAKLRNLLEVFDMIDICANGQLTLHELKPIFNIVSLLKAQHYELFHQVDEDMSGKIDFAEFCELIQLMESTFRNSSGMLQTSSNSNSTFRSFLSFTHQSAASSAATSSSYLADCPNSTRTMKRISRATILAGRWNAAVVASALDAVSEKTETDSSKINSQPILNPEVSAREGDIMSTMSTTNTVTSIESTYKTLHLWPVTATHSFESDDPLGESAPHIFSSDGSTVLSSINSAEDVGTLGVVDDEVKEFCAPNNTPSPANTFVRKSFFSRTRIVPIDAASEKDYQQVVSDEAQRH